MDADNTNDCIINLEEILEEILEESPIRNNVFLKYLNNYIFVNYLYIIITGFLLFVDDVILFFDIDYNVKMYKYVMNIIKLILILLLSIKYLSTTRGIKNNVS